ncbi:condensation domain-containing protein [Nonomuraea sp. NPDC059023]|uniref:condensation domain-containing protein n=1 Tax=unclassified Nonomuraea TaxID=2593643 RepID=UPI0036CFA07C
MTEAPLTWGQQDVWRAVVAAAPQEQYLNLARLFVPQRPVTPERAHRALDRLITRHEALRTRLTGPRTAPRQALAESAEPQVEVVEGERPHRVSERLSAAPFDYGNEWPLRVAFLVADGYVRQVVLVLCPLAVDGPAADLVVRDFRALLGRGELPPHQADRPRDLAAWQVSGDGRGHSDEVIAWWLEQYARIDPFELTATPRRPRYMEATMSSPALAAAVRTVAARRRVSSSTALLTGAVSLAGRLTGQRTCGMRVTVDNRSGGGRRDVVSTIAQEGLVVLDLGTPDFGELLARGRQAVSRADRRAEYNPYAMEEALAGRVRTFGRFDDRRPVRHDQAPELDARQIRLAMDKTDLAWTDAMDRNICDFHLRVAGEPDRTEVSLYADTGMLSPLAIEAYLLDLERLFVEESLV